MALALVEAVILAPVALRAQGVIIPLLRLSIREGIQMTMLRTVALALVAALALSVTVACGGDGEESATPTATATSVPATSAGATPTPVSTSADAPTANADSAITARGVAVIIDVIANDENADGAEVTAWSDGDGGSVSLRSDGRLVYAPGDGFDGTDSFGYTITAAGGDASGEVSITVLAPPGWVIDGRLYTYEELKPGTVPDLNAVVIGVVPHDMNEEGQIVGALDVANPDNPYDQRAFLREADGTYVFIDMPGTVDYTTSDARGINDNGLVSGTYFNEDGYQSFLWDMQQGDPAPFAADGATQTYAGKLNNSGTVTGYANGDGYIRASDGTFTFFGVAEDEETFAWVIDDAGNVWGSANYSRGFHRDSDGELELIVFTNSDGTDSTGAWIRGVNSDGEMVGNYSEGDRTAALYVDADGNQVRLLLPGSDANGYDILTDIQDDGTILAWSNQDGRNHGFILTPVDPQANVGF